MRKFKFRVWSTERKKMIYPERDGWYQKAFKGDNGYWQTATISILFEVDKVKVMQWTGLKDKNGKEIYEGDVVESFTIPNGYICRGVVIFENGSFLMDVKNAPFAESGFKADFDERICEYTVLGNIYEHPHLLKEVKK